MKKEKFSLRAQLEAAKAEIARLKKITRCQREADESTLGGLIQLAREEAGMTLRDAAKNAGLSAGSLSRMERDAVGANPTLKTLQRVANVVGKPLSALFLQWEKETAGKSACITGKAE